MDMDFTTVTPDEFGREGEKTTCSVCGCYRACTFDGADGIGWCCEYERFVHADDDDECFEVE